MAPSLLARVTGSLVAAVGTFVSPPRCAACDARFGARARAIFCPACAATIERLADDGDEIAPLAYGGAVATAIAKMKYADRPDLARPLADVLRAALDARGARRAGGPHELRPDVVIPVPLHAARLAARGYNQSALLARPLARHLGVAFAPRALVRTRDTPKQTAQGRAARATNVAGAFAARSSAEIRGARVLLVDDVRTTGATLAACAEVLCAAGAQHVRVAVVASVGGSAAAASA